MTLNVVLKFVEIYQDYDNIVYIMCGIWINSTAYNWVYSIHRTLGDPICLQILKASLVQEIDIRILTFFLDIMGFQNVSFKIKFDTISQGFGRKYWTFCSVIHFVMHLSFGPCQGLLDA